MELRVESSICIDICTIWLLRRLTSFHNYAYIQSLPEFNYTMKFGSILLPVIVVHQVSTCKSAADTTRYGLPQKFYKKNLQLFLPLSTSLLIENCLMTVSCHTFFVKQRYWVWEQTPKVAVLFPGQRNNWPSGTFSNRNAFSVGCTHGCTERHSVDDTRNANAIRNAFDDTHASTHGTTQRKTNWST